jgi:hypothetical protein
MPETREAQERDRDRDRESRAAERRAREAKGEAPTNRERWEQAFDEGGSVVYQGEIITDPEDLPGGEIAAARAEVQERRAGRAAEGRVSERAGREEQPIPTPTPMRKP